MLLARSALLLACLLLVSCSSGTGEQGAKLPVLNLRIEHRAGERALQPEQTLLQTASGEALRLSSLRYYLSNIALVDADGTRTAAAGDPASDRGYFLIDESQPASRALRVEGLAPGRYTQLEFLLGIDETRNRAGAQTGVLDPARGMFWTWHTGYIFFALEGRSEPEGRALEFHVGGDSRYARRVQLPLPQDFALGAEGMTDLHLVADLGSILSVDPGWGLADVHGAVQPDASARLADAYSRMFRIESAAPAQLALAP